jgi:hypothetical protein
MCLEAPPSGVPYCFIKTETGDAKLFSLNGLHLELSRTEKVGLVPNEVEGMRVKLRLPLTFALSHKGRGNIRTSE